MTEKLKSKGLEYIPPELIERNPENPRIVFDESLLKDLQDSINELGILVPLIVFYDEVKGKYLLLDGERRLRCANALKLTRVPANIVAKPTRLQNILEMFNIHNVRIEWGPMEVAWKLKVIMEEFNYTKEKDLSKLTSLKPSEIRKAKLLLSYEKKYQDLVHQGPKQGGIKEDFLIELKPTLTWVGKYLSYSKESTNQLTDKLIEKHKAGVIKNYVRDFRDLNKIVKSEMPLPKVEQIIKKIASDPKFSIEDAFEESVKYSITIKEIDKRAEKLLGLLEDLNLKGQAIENETLLNTLSKLNEAIEKILHRERK